MLLLIASVRQRCLFFPVPWLSFIYLGNIAAMCMGWMIIVVDTMRRTAEHWVALSSYRLKWLWWVSKVLVEAQEEPKPSPVSLTSLHKCSTDTECHPLLHYIFTPSFLSLFSSLHKSPLATFSLPSPLFSLLHFVTEACSVLIIPVEPWFTFL